MLHSGIQKTRLLRIWEWQGKYFRSLGEKIVLSFVLTQNERTKEKVKTDEKYGVGDII
jgi:hypothetical protein